MLKKEFQSVLNALRLRLAAVGKTASKDDNGNTVYIDAEIIDDNTLSGFLDVAIFQSNFHWGDGLDSERVYGYAYQSALVSALGFLALRERSREFTIRDKGVEFSPPCMSDILMQQYQTEHKMLMDMNEYE